ncbi:hypothetical protein DFQ28_005885 [Apophysomyces sp. BC1034]|nr:hypothetical protein DFQ28_005885 [Apophysomyces sp. BC1034]
MAQYPNIPLIAVGISNPQDLQRAVTSGIPIIHLQRNCLALKGAQRRHVREMHAWRATQLIGLVILWGSSGAYVSKKSIPNGLSWVMKSCVGAAALSLTLYTLRLMFVLRSDYDMVQEKNEFFLLRDDVGESRVRHVMRIWLPFSVAGVAIGRFVRTLY